MNTVKDTTTVTIRKWTIRGYSFIIFFVCLFIYVFFFQVLFIHFFKDIFYSFFWFYFRLLAGNIRQYSIRFCTFIYIVFVSFQSKRRAAQRNRRDGQRERETERILLLPSIGVPSSGRCRKLVSLSLLISRAAATGGGAVRRFGFHLAADAGSSRLFLSSFPAVLPHVGPQQ